MSVPLSTSYYAVPKKYALTTADRLVRCQLLKSIGDIVSLRDVGAPRYITTDSTSRYTC